MAVKVTVNGKDVTDNVVLDEVIQPGVDPDYTDAQLDAAIDDLLSHITLVSTRGKELITAAFFWGMTVALFGFVLFPTENRGVLIGTTIATFVLGALFIVRAITR